MTERGKSARTERIELLCWAALLAAVVPNTVAAFASPDAVWWEALRFGLSTAFALALLALVASRIADRRQE
jgi:TctA family transporter